MTMADTRPSGLVYWRAGCARVGPDLAGARAYGRGGLHVGAALAPHYDQAVTSLPIVRHTLLDADRGGPRVMAPMLVPGLLEQLAWAGRLAVGSQLRPSWCSPSGWPRWQSAGRITLRGEHAGYLPSSRRGMLGSVAPDGVLISADLTAAHAHITAAITGDRALVADLADHPDTPYLRIGHALGVPVDQHRAAGKTVVNPMLNGCTSSSYLQGLLARKGITTAVDPVRAFHASYPGVAAWHASIAALPDEIGFASPLGLVFRPPRRGSTHHPDGRPRSYLGARTAIMLQHTETVGMLRALASLHLRTRVYDPVRGRWDRVRDAPAPALDALGGAVRGWLYDGLLVEAPPDRVQEVIELVVDSMLAGMQSAIVDAARLYGCRDGGGVRPAVTTRAGLPGWSWGAAEAQAATVWRVEPNTPPRAPCGGA